MSDKWKYTDVPGYAKNKPLKWNNDKEDWDKGTNLME